MKTVSRQRKWQLKKKAEGKCIICGKIPPCKHNENVCKHSVFLTAESLERCRKCLEYVGDAMPPIIAKKKKIHCEGCPDCGRGVCHIGHNYSWNHLNYKVMYFHCNQERELDFAIRRKGILAI